LLLRPQRTALAMSTPTLSPNISVIPDQENGSDQLHKLDGEDVVDEVQCQESTTWEKVKAKARVEIVRIVSIVIILLASFVCIGLDVERTLFISLVTLLLGILLESPLSIKQMDGAKEAIIKRFVRE